MAQGSIDVSVVVLTYFHEDYVAQALDSILTQETSLRYEILIGDDASGDRTQEIIRPVSRYYPARAAKGESGGEPQRLGCEPPDKGPVYCLFGRR